SGAAAMPPGGCASWTPPQHGAQPQREVGGTERVARLLVLTLGRILSPEERLELVAHGLVESEVKDDLVGDQSDAAEIVDGDPQQASRARACRRQLEEREERREIGLARGLARSCFHDAGRRGDLGSEHGPGSRASWPDPLALSLCTRPGG